jgi:hypothetical protein
LLRIHRERLPRADAEEGRVESAGVPEEAALPDVARTDATAIRVVQALDIPTAVRGEAGHRVDFPAQQVPQIVGGAHATGIAARHPDDGQRLGLGCQVRLGRAGRRPRDEGVQVSGDRAGGRVIEDQRGRQGQPGRHADPVAQLHRGDRVEPEFPERAVRVDLGRVAVPEHGRGLCAHQLAQRPFAGLGRQVGEPACPGRVLLIVGRLVDRLGLGQLVEQRARGGRGEHGQEAVPCDIRDRHARLVVIQCLLQAHDGQLGRHEPHAPAAHPGALPGVVPGVVPMRAEDVPDAPGDRGRRHPAGTASLCQRVQVGVRRGVGTVVGDAPDAGDRGEQHERLQRRRGEQLVEVPCAGDLRAQRRGVVRRRRLAHGAELGVHGEVEHGTQRTFRRDRVEHRRKGVAVGHIAGRDGDRRAQLGQLRPEFLGTRCPRPVSAQQQEVLGAGAGEPAGELDADHARRAGDEHGSPRSPTPWRGTVADRRAPQPSYVQAGRPDRHLVLVARLGERGREPFGGLAVQRVRQVDQPTPERRVLQGDHPTQPPHLRLDRPGGVVPVHRDRTARGEPQRRGQTGVGHRLCQGQGTGQPAWDRGMVRMVALVHAEQRQHTAVLTAGEVPEPRGQVGAVGSAGIHRQEHRLRAVIRECSQARVRHRRVVPPGRRHDDPRAAQRGRAGLLRPPVDPVPPIVHCGPVPAALVPPG